jgi:hypothetical protein
MIHFTIIAQAPDGTFSREGVDADSGDDAVAKIVARGLRVRGVHPCARPHRQGCAMFSGPPVPCDCAKAPGERQIGRQS